jgi:PTH1 family peptidyl-tRNA hydrolase
MNRSGEVIQSLFKRSGLSKENLIVICDTMDLPVGSLRLKARGASGGHNGLKSLTYYLQGEDFFRLYVGIGRPRDGTDVVSHVLGYPVGEEKMLLERSFDLAAAAVLKMLRVTPEVVMNEIN